MNMTEEKFDGLGEIRIRPRVWEYLHPLFFSIVRVHQESLWLGMPRKVLSCQGKSCPGPSHCVGAHSSRRFGHNLKAFERIPHMTVVGCRNRNAVEIFYEKEVWIPEGDEQYLFILAKQISIAGWKLKGTKKSYQSTAG